MSFSDDIRRFTTKTTEAHNKIARTATLELFGGVVKATPVDTGRARGAWTTSTGAPTDSPERLDKSGGEAIAEIDAKTPAGAGQVTYLSNTLPYIMALEEGSSTQAEPGAMVRTNFARVQRMVQKAVEKHRV